MKTDKETKPTVNRYFTDKIINFIDTIWDDYWGKGYKLNDRAMYYPGRLWQTIKAHQTGAFLTGNVTELPRNSSDSREFRDVVTRTVDTSTANTDLDAENLDVFTYSGEHDEEEFISKSIFTHYKIQSQYGQVMNNFDRILTDDGNIIVRFDQKIKLPKDVNPLNIAVANPMVESLEETDVVEEQIIGQSELMERMQDDGYIYNKAIFDECNVSDSPEIPRYQVRLCYAEISTDVLNGLRKEAYGKDTKQYQSSSEHVLVIYIRAKNTEEDDDEETKAKGYVVYADITPKEEIQVTKDIKIIRYKPYEFARLGNFNKRLFGKGHREIGIPHQNKCNKIAIKIDRMLDHLKVLYECTDENLLGKDVIKGYQEGQVIYHKPGTQFNVLVNNHPALQLLIEQWNMTVNELEKDVKAFEVATGEMLPASTSATAIAISDDRIGKYYSLKREKLGFLHSTMFKRWILPDLLENIDTEEKIEIVGDPEYINEYIDRVAEKDVTKMIIDVALRGGIATKDGYNQLKELVKSNLMKKKKHFYKLEEEFLKDCELYVGLNSTNENFNKNKKLSNSMNLINWWNNPQLTPQARSILEQVTKDQGLKVPKGADQEPGQGMPQDMPQRQPVPANKPIKEEAETL